MRETPGTLAPIIHGNRALPTLGQSHHVRIKYGRNVNKTISQCHRENVPIIVQSGAYSIPAGDPTKRERLQR